ncbi:MAG TPA: serine/threonine-protein kinase [Bryobacteraceae bacterium]|nr:serine/threonine-protein kinase [Bryobacteraceae bacterium]
MIKKGDIVGDYKVIDLAGSGGMAAVYKIEHIISKRIEAMKVLPVGIGSGPEEVRRFEREIEVQARLHHPNIVALYNAVRDSSSIALIMEYVEGESLQLILERGKLPLRTAVAFASQVLDALAYAHRMGVIHRDVAPANVIVNPEGIAKLADFGLALAATDVRLTGPGVAMGSAWYMAPEQVKATGQLDARSDIYAVGAVLHEMLTGKKLFDADGSFAVMRAQLEEIPQPPSMDNPEVSKALDEVLAKALAKDAAARFQSAAEFRLALEAAATGMQPEASVSKSSSRRAGPRPPRAAIALTLAPAALVAVVCLAWLWSGATRVGAPARVPQDVVVTRPALVKAPPFAAEPARPDPAAVARKLKVPVQASEPETEAASTYTRFMQPAGRQTLEGRDSGGIAESLSAMSPPKPPSRVLERAPQPYAAAAPQVPPLPTPAETSAEAQAAAQTTGEAKASKSGNRFIRVLDKLNPFRRGAKNDSGDQPEAATTERVVE